jgi:type VI secretion system secreted protein VgrG
MGNQSTKLGMGNQTTKLDLGKIETEAMQSIELKVGQSSIKIDQMGVTIKGMMISVQAQVQCEVKATITQVSGDAMLMEKGGIVMIN